MKVMLFDIDGTLLLSGGAGMRSMNKTFFEWHGIENAFAGFHFQGKVDPAIFREALHLHKLRVADEDDEIKLMLSMYENFIAEEMPKSTQAQLMPGVREFLAKLHDNPDVSLGLLTGNVYGGAKAKLSHFDLWRYFPFGAFGSDHEVREALVPIALERASAYLGKNLEPGKDVFIIGDTDRDIECAQANNCTAVGVATLGFSVEQLQSLGADFVFSDLSDADEVMRTLGVDHG